MRRLDDHLYIQPGCRDQLHVNPFNPKQYQRHEAITALIAGGLIMIYITRLRRTLPRYIAIYGGAQRYCHLCSDHDVWSFVPNTGSGLDSLVLLIFLRFVKDGS